MGNTVSRIKQYIDFKGISIRKFEESVGFSNGAFASQYKNNRTIGVDKVENILCAYRDINPIWLLTGNGEMLEKKNDIDEKNSSIEIAPQNCPPKLFTQKTELFSKKRPPIEKTEPTDNNVYFDGFTQKSQPTLQPFSRIYDKRLERQQVPLYDIDASAGIVPILDGRTTPVDYVSIPDLPRCDGGVSVRGDSMYPLLKSGDIVLFKNIHDFGCIVWGEMYLISFRYDDEEFCVIKYIQKGETSDKIKLVSYNEHHNPIEIYRADIRALAVIKASVRFNTMM